jgi:hypothetical protein
MIRHGFARCDTCHVDPMGGETLTRMGRAMAGTLLSTPWGEEPSSAARFLFGLEEPDHLYLGGSVRALGLWDLDNGTKRAFPMQADLTAAADIGRFTLAASIGGSRASARYEHSSKARLIGNVNDEGFILVSRNHWLGYRPSDGWLLRLGRINLPFGIRTPEHTLWVRSETLTDRESDQQHGLALAYSGPRWRGELMGSLGNFQRPGDRLRERGYSGSLEYFAAPKVAVGASSLVLVARRDPALEAGHVVRQAHGLTLRASPHELLVVLTEANVLSTTGSSVGYVGRATLDLEAVAGLHLAATGELLDRGKPPSGSAVGRGKPHAGAWLTLDWFFAPHLELRVDLVWRHLRPEMLQAQLHMFL